MDVLVLHLSAPLQSWGAAGRFDKRDTQPSPTKSAVIGMLAACLGRSRGTSMADLAALDVCVRTDRGGILLRDYHTANAQYDKGRWMSNAEGKPHGAKGHSTPVVTDRWYLSDAAFTVTIGGDDGLVRKLLLAAQEPRFIPYLGRRNCPPNAGWLVGVVRAPSPTDAARHVVPLVRRDGEDGPIAYEADDVNGIFSDVRDLPTGPLNQRYSRRRVRRWSSLPEDGVAVVCDGLALSAYVSDNLR